MASLKIRLDLLSLTVSQNNKQPFMICLLKFPVSLNIFLLKHLYFKDMHCSALRCIRGLFNRNEPYKNMLWLTYRLDDPKASSHYYLPFHCGKLTCYYHFYFVLLTFIFMRLRHSYFLQLNNIYLLTLTMLFWKKRL